MKRFLLSCAILLALATTAVAQLPPMIRVNCGGPAYTDTRGQTWQGDTGFTGGQAESTAAAISGTPDQGIFRTVRWNPTNYSFGIPAGVYVVNLLFAEVRTSVSTGGRIFSVNVQGTTVLQNFDTFASAGGVNKAVIKTIQNVQVTSGNLLIEFIHVSGLMPKISGIEILPAVPAGAPRLTLNFVHLDGTTVSGTLSYAVTSSLFSFQGSTPLVNGQAVCYLVTAPGLLGFSTTYQVSLNLKDVAGNILWEVDLGMNPSKINFGAVQDTLLNVSVQ